MGFTEKFLNKSNSYNYYKTNYEKLLKSEKKLNKENETLKESLKDAKAELFESEKKNESIKKCLKENEIELIKLQKKLGSFTKPAIINKLINNDYSDLTIAIKSPNPKIEHHWGDYFFALSLKKSFEKKGFNVIIQEKEDWYCDVDSDIDLVLRGLVEYYPDFSKINIMWNISHPDMVTTEEMESYDICFISSEKYSSKLSDKLDTVVRPLLQCTDPDVFHTSYNKDVSQDVLFVGITRGVYREIVKDALETDFDVSIYGSGWEEFIDEKYIKGEFIPNDKLHEYYSSCKILLNDHWEDMRDLDFPSNRLFDALACGAFVISDEIPSAESLFEGNIVTYENSEDLNNKISYYLAHEDERIQKAKKGQEIVLNNHTFDNRVDSILNCLKEL